MSQWAELRHQHFVEEVSEEGAGQALWARHQDRPSGPRVRAAAAAGFPVVAPALLDPHYEEIKALLREDPKITAKRIGRLLEPTAGQVKPRTATQVRGPASRRSSSPRRPSSTAPIGPGDTMEADFGESWAIIAGELRKVKFFVTTLPCSNVYFARAYPVERLECLLDGLAESFAFFGGVTRARRFRQHRRWW